MKQPSITFDKMTSPVNTFGSPAIQTARRKRMLLYARVSTEEQTKGNYPSCDSQVEELEAECLRRGWEVHRTIKDEGYTAGTMRRPGLTEMRWLVQAREVDGILCTWYDRLTRSREFYILDHEFRSNNVELVTLHDATDTKTAAGRFMESVIVAAKTYDRDQTSEKVRIKMRMRLEKGLHQGGLVPFGFTMDAKTKILHPEPEQIKVIEQLFRVYVEQRSDFAVRNWLKAHQIPSPRGKALWQVSTIHDLLCNRRYIGEIEINRDNKGVEDLPEMDQYRVAQAPHGALIPVELFELAQVVRNEKRADSPNRVGKPHSYSQTQTGRVYTLQGILTCGCCTHAMTPWYVRHKAGGQRRRESYVHYYVCAQQQRLWKQCDHKNMILARLPEQWILDRISDLVTTDNLVEQVIAVARAKCESQLQPEVERLSLTRAALAENQTKIDQMLETISSGQARGDLLHMMNEKATQLKLERERLKSEVRQLSELLQPLGSSIVAADFQEALAAFMEVAESAEPEEVQRLLRLLVRRIEWIPEGGHRVDYYHLPGLKRPKDWFQTNVRSGCPRHRNVEPVFLHLIFVQHTVLQLDLSLFQAITSCEDSIRKPHPAFASIVNSKSAGTQHAIEREEEMV